MKAPTKKSNSDNLADATTAGAQTKKYEKMKTLGPDKTNQIEKNAEFVKYSISDGDLEAMMSFLSPESFAIALEEALAENRLSLAELLRFARVFYFWERIRSTTRHEQAESQKESMATLGCGEMEAFPADFTGFAEDFLSRIMLWCQAPEADFHYLQSKLREAREDEAQSDDLDFLD